MNYDAVIIGGGAAGLMCAITAGKRGRKVALLEHNKQLGRKILISGGGRCNFTNRDVAAENFFSQNKHYAKSALNNYGPYDFVELVESHQIPYFEKTLGQLFCEKSAKDIVGMLALECKKVGVDIFLNSQVKQVEKKEESFLVICNDKTLSAQSLIIATGGLSITQIGASDFGHRVAKQFGHKLVETRPALVPFTYKDFSDLSGVALPSRIKTGGAEFEEAVLFTHKGLSGPAILQASLYWDSGQEVVVDFLPGVPILEKLKEAKRKNGNQKVFNFLKPFFPDRFLERWCRDHLTAPEIELANQKGEELERLAISLNSWSFIPEGTEGYRKAEVTRGGVSVNELSSKTMESQKVSGLFFIGEVVDVTGWLGGYNFQWAWASGYAAGLYV